MSDSSIETVDTITDEMRKFAQKCRKKNFGIPPECELHYDENDIDILVDRLKAAVRRERKEIVDAVREATDGMCLHCDMQDQCADGEDGMSTTCNAMAKVRNFIDMYGTCDKDEVNDDCPF